MRSSAMTMAAALAAAAIGLTAAGAHAEPAQDRPTQNAPAPTPDLRGSTGGVDYRMTVTEDHRATVTDITGGRFELVHDDRIVTINDADGRVLAALPMTLHIQDHDVDLIPTVDEAGTRLTLTPAEQAAAPLRDISSYERFHEATQRAMPEITAAAGIGAAIGALLGFPLGLFVFDFITVPLGAVIGGVAGAFVGLYNSGGQPAVDAAIAYLTGQP
ncbi:hypothetical protein [Nocardia shimofusensis]|uniref:hypothetical protein n=1 Tax=Nocardia shimofusensis TaxID=228596 RepID=UPI00082D3AF6|nr:hypothetical protein [Nocardia shimofusensis]